MVQVKDIGEQGLLKRLQPFCAEDVVGDDAAVLTIPSGFELVVTTDVLVDGVHFSDQTTRPEEAGWRAIAANLSDLAAMGATPMGVTVGLAVPRDLSVDWVERLYTGMGECLQRYGGAIVGGDVVRSPVTSLAITAFGKVQPEQMIRRTGAQPGWAIVATGAHGSSRAGLELLLHPEQAIELSEGDRAALIRSHQRPIPRLDIPPLLSEIPVAGMDSSDGLADAVLQICRMSQVGARLTRQQIPISPALTQWVNPAQAMQWALYGGEDFELVLALPIAAAQKLVARIGGSAAMIGVTTVEPEVWLVDALGQTLDEPLNLEQGFQHFSESQT